MKILGNYHHVHLVCEDPHEIASWYVKHLGARILHSALSRGSTNIRLGLGEVNLYIRGIRPNENLEPREADNLLGFHHIGLLVDDIEEAIRSVVDGGGELLVPVHTGSTGNWVAFVKAAGGLKIEFLQHKQEA